MAEEDSPVVLIGQWYCARPVGKEGKDEERKKERGVRCEYR